MNSKKNDIKLHKFIWYCLWTQSTVLSRIYLTLAFIIIVATIGIKLSVPFFLKQIVAELSAENTIFDWPITWLVISYATVWCIAQNMQAVRDIIVRMPIAKATDRSVINLITHNQNL